MDGEHRHRWLWIAFVGLFALVAAAAVAPVEPVVAVFPFWSLLVLAACSATILVGYVAVRMGWPPEVSEA